MRDVEDTTSPSEDIRLSLWLADAAGVAGAMLFRPIIWGAGFAGAALHEGFTRQRSNLNLSRTGNPREVYYNKMRPERLLADADYEEAGNMFRTSKRPVGGPHTPPKNSAASRIWDWAVHGVKSEYDLDEGWKPNQRRMDKVSETDTRRIIRVEAGSDADTWMKKNKGKSGYWSVGDVSRNYELDPPKSSFDFKAKMGILDADPTGIHYRANLVHRGTSFRDEIRMAPKGKTGVRALTSKVTALPERFMREIWDKSAAVRIGQKLGITEGAELRLLRQADELGLVGDEAIDYVTNQSRGRHGSYYHPAFEEPPDSQKRFRSQTNYQLRPGGELRGAEKGVFRTPTGVAADDALNEPAMRHADDVEVRVRDPDAPRVKMVVDDAPIVGKTPAKAGKTAGNVLPVVAGLDDFSVVGQDLLEEDYAFALVHTGDAIVDSVFGPYSLLITVPTDLHTGANTRGVFSAGLAWLGIEEKVDTQSAIEYGIQTAIMSEADGNFREIDTLQDSNISYGVSGSRAY